MKRLLPLIAVFMAGCSRPEVPSTSPVTLTQVHSSAIPRGLNTPQSAVKVPEVLSFNGKLPFKIPPTARTIEPFRRLKKGMNGRTVVSIVGLGKANPLSSTNYKADYPLSDGSYVTLGYGSILFKAHHLVGHQDEDLLRGQK